MTASATTLSAAQHTHALILAGGVGSRFWPVSRAATPKQLLDPFGRGSLLRMTADRLTPLVPPERQWVVTGQLLGEAVRRELPELPADQVLEEPTGRNTAPAIGWGCRRVLALDPDAIVAVLPADHFIADEAAYRAAIALAVELAADGAIATLGIQPTHPETGYGYIQATPDPAAVDPAHHGVTAFHEKPDRATAAAYLGAGGFWWNAGMFFARADVLLGELARFEPELALALQSLDGAPRASIDAAYPSLKSISIDYAVMERTDLARVVPCSCGWSDIGSWSALKPADRAASYHHGDVIELQGCSNVLYAQGGLVAVIGVEGLAVVHTPDATLVCPVADAQRVRELVDALTRAGRGELL